jgi:hypothetical protein
LSAEKVGFPKDDIALQIQAHSDNIG